MIIYPVTQTNKRKVKPFRAGSGIVVVIPKDWVDGMEIVPGELLEMSYDGELTLRKLKNGSLPRQAREDERLVLARHRRYCRNCGNVLVGEPEDRCLECDEYALTSNGEPWRRIHVRKDDSRRNGEAT